MYPCIVKTKLHKKTEDAILLVTIESKTVASREWEKGRGRKQGETKKNKGTTSAAPAIIS
jgi:hypothetical protein